MDDQIRCALTAALQAQQGSRIGAGMARCEGRTGLRRSLWGWDPTLLKSFPILAWDRGVLRTNTKTRMKLCLCCVRMARYQINKTHKAAAKLLLPAVSIQPAGTWILDLGRTAVGRCERVASHVHASPNATKLRSHDTVQRRGSMTATCFTVLPDGGASLPQQSHHRRSIARGAGELLCALLTRIRHDSTTRGTRHGPTAAPRHNMDWGPRVSPCHPGGRSVIKIAKYDSLSSVVAVVSALAFAGIHTIVVIRDTTVPVVGANTGKGSGFLFRLSRSEAMSDDNYHAR